MKQCGIELVVLFMPLESFLRFKLVYFNYYVKCVILIIIAMTKC